jgi:pimeloyl-ACP methyl ester carboxylesterase
MTEPPPADGLWTDWGGTGSCLHLAHGNGFPPRTYRKLAERLRSTFRVSAMAARPLWGRLQPETLRDWRELAQDLRSGLRARGLERVVGVGHSLGAVITALAALEEPELFSSVVLVDPVLLSGVRAMTWGAMKSLGLAQLLPLVRRTRSRRRHWPDEASAAAAWAQTPAFRLWDPEVLADYARAGTVPAPEGGVTLRYPREWEARIFELSPHDLWRELSRLPVPALFVRGGRSTTFTRAAASRAERRVPGARVLELPGTTHFVPMERPAELAELVCRQLA